MHRKLYIVFILVDALFISGILLLNEICFLHIYDISGFVVFCAVQLSMAVFWLIKGIQFDKRKGIVLTVGIIFCVVAYLFLMPRYTIVSAKDKVQKASQFSNFKIYNNTQTPTMGAIPRPGLLVKDCYCFVAISSEKTYDIRFNPVQGNFDVLSSYNKVN